MQSFIPVDPDYFIPNRFANSVMLITGAAKGDRPPLSGPVGMLVH